MSLQPSALLVAIALVSTACDGTAAERDAGRGGDRRELALSEPVALHGPAGTLLAKPDMASEDSRGRIVFPDFSDRNVKVYDATGALAAILGRAGSGPGEFAALMTAQAYHDSVVAYDMDGSRLSVFGPDGRFAGARAPGFLRVPMPFTLRVVDDSLFLLIAPGIGAPHRKLLALVRPDGSIRSQFLDPARSMGGGPQVAQAVGLVADGAGGRVFAAVAGGDSVWAFDYDGRRVAAFPADPEQPLVTARSLIEANGGRLRKPGGGSAVDGNRMIVELVAMDSGTVALQIAPYDGRLGIDLEEGGTFVVSTLAGRGARLLARREMVGALLGRDRRGRLLILRYTSPEAEAHELVRATLVPVRPR
ncbi:MAG TPA: hypothetical protein VGO40_13340 [Longimicrobium sp.]|jgi:hypothetical protein|nr:hypothetical protein [Longimicrobium sp.]